MGKTCLRVGCKKPAVYAPKLTVPMAGIVSDKDQPFIALLSDLFLCETHIKQVRPEHFPNLKELFKKKLGGAAVDWTRAEFEGVQFGL